MSTKTDFDADEKRLLDSADRILGGAGEMLNRIDLGPTGIAWVMAVQLLAERFKHAVRRQKKAMGEEAEPIREQLRRQLREWAKRTMVRKATSADMQASANHWLDQAMHRVGLLVQAIDAAERHLIPVTPSQETPHVQQFLGVRGSGGDRRQADPGSGDPSPPGRGEDRLPVPGQADEA